MNLFGFNISRLSAAPTPIPPSRSAYGEGGGWTQIFNTGDPALNWQINGPVVDCQESLLAFSAVYSCVTLIADDISKLAPRLMAQSASGAWQPYRFQSPFSGVLRVPNRYQTPQQFLAYWTVCKLLWGNTYVLKERDARGIVTALYILDPSRTKPMIAPDGSVYYSFGQDNVNGITEAQVLVPASEIVHDRMNCLFHPLVGVAPIYACGASATQGNRIQANSAQFFNNMSRPSGTLSSPNVINNETAKRLKGEFEKNFSGPNIGKLLVMGDGLQYTPMTIPAQQAQLIEQLRWTGEDVARCFHVPPHKIGLGTAPTFNNISAMNLDYLGQTLGVLIESIEGLLDAGLGLPSDRRVELDVRAFLRLDPLARAEAAQRAVGAGYLAPNEARAAEDLEPVAGGDTPYLQVQNFSLEALAQRDAPTADTGAEQRATEAIQRATLALHRRALRGFNQKRLSQ